MKSVNQGGFEELLKIPVSDIVDKTHIRTDIIRAIMQKDFGQIHAVKARGFISILEREYHLDLEEWIREYMDFRREENHVAADQGYFVVAEQSEEEQKLRMKKWGMGALVLAVLLVIGYILSHLTTSSSPSADSNSDIPLFEVNQTVENNESNETNTSVVAIESNVTEVNVTSATEQNVTVPTQGSGVVTPGKKIWIGLRNVTDKNFQSISGIESFELSNQKEYLLQAGHGEFVIQFAGKTYKPQTMHFTRLYIAKGVIKEVSKDEFEQMEKKAKYTNSISE